MKPIFFATPAGFRAWLDKHHSSAPELLVGFYKRDSGKASMTWPESVDAALCYGWIDGVRKSLGDDSYTIRFTPRKPRSNWSAINIKRVGELTNLGLMSEAGLAAFGRRSDESIGNLRLRTAARSRLRSRTRPAISREPQSMGIL